MLFKVSDLLRCRLEDDDGEIGVVKDVYFDDATWETRYLVIDLDAAGWLSRHDVVLSPEAITAFDPENGFMTTRLTRAQVLEAPPSMADDEVEQEMFRSFRELRGFSIRATDGELGHVDDLVIDDRDWRICKIVVDTGNWLFGKKVAVDVGAVIGIEWTSSRVAVQRERQALRDLPRFDPEAVRSAAPPTLPLEGMAP